MTEQTLAAITARWKWPERWCQSKGLSCQRREAQADIHTLLEMVRERDKALQESVALQSHYAVLLNDYDGASGAVLLRRRSGSLVCAKQVRSPPSPTRRTDRLDGVLAAHERRSYSEFVAKALTAAGADPYAAED